MTERARESLIQSGHSLTIGSSHIDANSSSLTFHIEEKTALLGSRVAGKIEIEPSTLTDFECVLDEHGRHRWCPLAPKVRVRAEFNHPSLSWSGTGYLDMNSGAEPLEDGFTFWNWSRANLPKETAILYDVTHRSGSPLSLCLRIDGGGEVETVALPHSPRLPRTLVWRMPRRTRSDPSGVSRILKTLEDTPFYSRSMISTQIFGETAVAMHESLSLDRFRSKAVQTLLPYRMPRVGGSPR